MVAPASATIDYTPLTLPELNATILPPTLGGEPFVQLFPQPLNPQTFNGVPFNLVKDSNDNTVLWEGVFNIPVNVFGVTQAYTLINSGFGTFGATNGSVEFIGTNGANYKVDLVQGDNIRDYYNGTLNNSAPNTTLAFSSGSGTGNVRLDQQTYTLPSAFASETLQTIRFTSFFNDGSDNYNDNLGKPFITAATVGVNAATVPEPATLALIGVGLVGLGFSRRRRA